MNYIREELLRQQRLLTLLAGGGETVREDRERAAAPDSLAAEPDRTARTGADRRRPDRDVAWEDGGTLPGREETGGDSGDGDRAVWPSNEESLPGRTAERRRAGGRLRPVERRSEASALEGEAVGTWNGKGRGSGAASAAELRAVSRGFQRDARRYDGGFSMY